MQTDDSNDIVSLDMVDEKAVIKLKSLTGDIVEVNHQAAMMSHLIQKAVENDKQSDEPIELQCSTDAIQRIVAYLTYHAKEPPRSIQKPLLSTDMKELVCEFDCQFTDVDHDTMFNVLLAANYMDIQPLLLLMCAKVASLIKNRTPDEIRQTFNITEDYTPEDEEEVQKQFKDFLFSTQK